MPRCGGMLSLLLLLLLAVSVQGISESPPSSSPKRVRENVVVAYKEREAKGGQGGSHAQAPTQLPPLPPLPARPTPAVPPVAVGNTPPATPPVTQPATPPAKPAATGGDQPKSVDPGLELWKQRVESNVRTELAKETEFINKMMKKQQASAAKTQKLEAGLRYLIAHYRASQKKAHESAVIVHKLSHWAHEAHGEIVAMEAKLEGKVGTLWDHSAEAFDALGAAGEQAAAELEAADTDDATVVQNAEAALGEPSAAEEVVSPAKSATSASPGKATSFLQTRPKGN